MVIPKIIPKFYIFENRKKLLPDPTEELSSLRPSPSPRPADVTPEPEERETRDEGPPERKTKVSVIDVTNLVMTKLLTHIKNILFGNL